MGKELAGLAKMLLAGSFIFPGDTTRPWLYQDNDYKAAKEAQNYLQEHNIGKRFNGALQPGPSDLPVFVKHLSWLTRCNAALPCFYFIDPEQNILGHICKYGNLHLGMLNEKTDKMLNDFMGNSKFRFPEGYKCYNQFGKSSAIAGRRTIF